ncbi:putative Secreted Protein (WYLE family) [Cryptosporidium felis]|nr:putative Secreted Protein (WYLE family) [Cryptosporidium felis]
MKIQFEKAFIVFHIAFILLPVLDPKQVSGTSYPKKTKIKTKVDVTFKKKQNKYDFVSKDGSILFSSLKAISEKNIPVLKTINELDTNYDEDLLGRNQVYIIRNGELPGWGGVKIPIHHAPDESKLRLKPPEQSNSISIFPPVMVERFMLFALEESLLPSKFFLQVAFCAFDAIYPFLEGIPSAETMQDIVGAAMYSINKKKGVLSFDLKKCLVAISMIPDLRLNSGAELKCQGISLCLHQDLFPQLSSSLNRFTLNQLIEKSFILHGLEYQLRIDSELEIILWKIIRATHKSYKWKNGKNPNKLYAIIRAYILSLYVRHSGNIVPGWYINRYPSPNSALSFVNIESEESTSQALFIQNCAKKLKFWLKLYQPVAAPILPNINTKKEVSESACFQAGRSGFVSSTEFDFSNMIEEGTESVDLYNLQLPIIFSKSEDEVEYIRKHNLRRSPEARWSHYHETYPYSSFNRELQNSEHTMDQNLQDLALSIPGKSSDNYKHDNLLLEVQELIQRKKKEIDSKNAGEELPSSKIPDRAFPTRRSILSPLPSSSSRKAEIPDLAAKLSILDLYKLSKSSPCKNSVSPTKSTVEGNDQEDKLNEDGGEKTNSIFGEDEEQDDEDSDEESDEEDGDGESE